MARMARGGNIIITQSIMETWHDCPRRHYYENVRSLKRKLSYSLLCGQEVHAHIQHLECGPAHVSNAWQAERRFYYRTIGSAIGAWHGRWKRALTQRAGELLLPDEAEAARYAKVGSVCTAQYWKRNVETPRPQETEAKYQAPFLPGVLVIGKLDQVRDVSTDWIERHRPALVRDGRLADGFAPQVIVDLKTSARGYDPRAWDAEPTPDEEKRLQYALHEDPQFTIYTWLYRQRHGRNPVGCQWVHLRSGKAFFTYRTEEHEQNFAETIYCFIRANEEELYQKHIGSHCAYCPHLDPCNADKDFLVVVPEGADDYGGTRSMPSSVTKSGERQLQFGLKIPRRRRGEEEIHPEKPIVLRDEPWDPPRSPDPESIGPLFRRLSAAAAEPHAEEPTP